MENPATSPKKSSKGGWISFLKGLLPTENGSAFVPPFSLIGWIFLLAGFFGAFTFGWVVYPVALYSRQPQPISFNHALHLDPDVGGIEGDTETEKCLYCHEFRDDGTFSGIPKLAKCTECHDDPESPLGETQQEKEFMEKYVAGQKEIPWLIYYRQPDCVYFSHIAHVKMGKIECQTCHGDHSKTEKLPIYRANLLTGYSINIWGKNIAGYKTNTWDRMKMDDCAECHTKKGHEENNACFVCHK